MMCISSANKISSASQRKGDRTSNTQLKKMVSAVYELQKKNKTTMNGLITVTQRN